MNARPVVATLALILGLAPVGCSPSSFRQSPLESMTPVTPEAIAAKRSPESLRADLDALVALHESACPDPYLRTDAATVHALRDRLKASIVEPMRRSDFLPFVMELQAAYRIDHIVQAVPQEDLLAGIDRGERLLPFRAEPEGQLLHVIAVSGAETQLEPGDRILELGGAPAAATIARLRSLVPGESERFQDRRMRDSFRSLSWAAGIRPPVTVRVRGRDGSVRACELAGVGRDARVNERVAAATESASAPTTTAGEVLVNEPPFRCELIEGDIALIDFPTMSGDLADRWDAFLKHAISAANERHAVGLIVDIRRNGGGDSNLGVTLLSHLTEKPYRLAGGMVWRKSEAGDESIRLGVKPAFRWLLPMILPSVIPGYGSVANGENLTFADEPESHPLTTPSFTGPSCLLIGEGTFSSAMMLADGVRTYDLMTTIGAPTGGIPTSLGELGFAQLPNSQLVVQFCQKKFLRASGDESEAGPVRPHIEVPASEPGDATLRRAIEEIRRQR